MKENTASESRRKAAWLPAVLLAFVLIALASLTLAGCGDLFDTHACSDKSECNDDDYIYCGDSSCESSEYYTIDGVDYYYKCDGVCDGD